MLDRFTKTYVGSYSHPAMVRHSGVLIAFAMRDDRSIVYAVLDLDAATSPLDVDAWPAAPRELPFPNEIAEVGYGAADQTRLPVFRTGAASPEAPGAALPQHGTPAAAPFDYLRSTTARLGAHAPFQVVSDGGFVYVFRQAAAAPRQEDDSDAARSARRQIAFVDAKGRVSTSADGSREALVAPGVAGPQQVYARQGAELVLRDPDAGHPAPLVDSTLLVDRFVLSGATLQPRIEVRFQRSRSRTRPASRKDGLGPRDLDGNFFFEPTQELRFVSGLVGGRFAALLVPTQVAEIQRWQIFAQNAATGRVDSYSVERSQDGLFNPRGSQIYTCPDHPEVFAARAARCTEPALADASSLCGKELVPRVVTEGHAESALQLPDRSAHVELAGDLRLGATWTVEAWLMAYRQQRAPQTAPDADRRVLLGGDGQAGGLTVAVDLQLRLYVSFGAGAGRVALGPTRRLLDEDAWRHLAITSDGQALRIYVGGRLREKLDLPAGAGAPTGRVASFGAPAGSFAGVLDEVRLWGRRRSERELGADMHQRLTGLEPGLAAYWRFDEAVGTADADGATVFEQVAGAANGTARGARWVASDAPVGESPGVARDSFGVVRHDPGALPAALGVGSGMSALLYFQQHSDVRSGYDNKNKPLKQNARVMLAFATSGAERPYLAALDFGVSAGGRVAMMPDRLELPLLTAAGAGAAPVTEQLDAVIDLEQQARVLAQALADAQGELAARQAELALLPDTAGQVVTIFSHPNFTGRSLEVSPGRGTSFPALDIRSIRVPTGLQATVLVRDVLAPEPEQTFTQDAPDVDIGRAGVLERASSVTAAVRPGYAEQRAAALQRAQQAAQEVDRLVVLLADARSALAARTAVLRSGAEVVMPLRYIDARGQTISGGLLGFAWSADAPLLFDSATGSVSLYFRGTDGQLFAAYYSTFTERARYTLRDAGGAEALTCVTSSADLDLDKLELEVLGGDDASPTCTLVVRGAGIEETWASLPRDPERMARALNGEAGDRTFVARGSLRARDGLLTLELPEGAGHAIEAGATLVVGALRVRSRQALARGGARASLPVDGPPAGLPAGTLPVYLLEYDYDSFASTTRVPADLYNGSLLLRAAAHPGARPAQQGQKVTSGATLTSRWTADAPGSTPVFDGAATRAGRAPTTPLAAFDTPGDLTLETWARPAAVAERARLLVHRSPASSYTLGVERRELPTALRLDGAHDMVTLPGVPELETAGSLTIEAWVRPKATDGFRTIVVHGHAFKTSEVYLRIGGGQYQAGSFTLGAGDAVAAIGIPPADALGKDWVHLAAVYDAQAVTWSIYRNGALGATAPAHVLPQIEAGWGIGGNPDPNPPTGQARRLNGALDEVRIWKRARTAAEILADMYRRLAGNETDLVGAWSFAGGLASDRARHGIDGAVAGSPTVVASPIPGFAPFAAVGERSVAARAAVPCGSWTHLAAAYDQSYGVRIPGSGFLDAGADPSLDLSRDLTIEVSFLAESLTGGAMLLSKGRLDDAPDTDDVPYALYLLPSGQLGFAFQDISHQIHTFSSDGAVTAGRFTTAAVSRERVNEQGQPVTEGSSVSVSQKTYDRIRLYINGALAGERRYEGALGATSPPEVGSSSGSLTFGSGSAIGLSVRTLRGVVSEARIWSVVRATDQVGRDIRGTEKGLISWWRFEEGSGRVAEDSKSRNHAIFKGDLAWVKDPNPTGSQLRLYVDGAPVDTAPMSGLAAGADQLAVGALLGETPSQLFRGELEELRIWHAYRTQEQIQDTMFQRAAPAEALAASYSFDIEPGGALSDRSGRGNHLALVGSPTFVLSTAPVGRDAPQVRSALAGVRTPFNALVDSRPAVHEYADLQADAGGGLSGVLKRSYGFVRFGALSLVTGYKVGDMTSEWVGQVQFQPQLVGFLEGAPPVPSENLTQKGVSLPGDLDDYNEASVVTLTEAQEASYGFAATRDSGFDMELGLGIRTGFQSTSEAGIGFISSIEDTRALAGIRAQFELSTGHLAEAGASARLSTGRATSLELRGRYTSPAETEREALGRRFVPDNIGLALVKSRTADVFALRLADTGALIAFQMRPNPDIPEDFNLISFPINPRYTKQGTLDGKVGLAPDVDYPSALEYSPDSSYFKPVEAYALKDRIAREELALRTRFEQYGAEAEGQRTSGGFHSGSLADKLTRLSKRNIANTYVWTADGGLFAETQESLDTVSEMVGGSYQFKGMAGFSVDFTVAIAKVAFQLSIDAMFGGHLNVTATKTSESSTGYALSIDLNRVERDIYARDDSGDVLLDATDPLRPRPIRVPGKVDAYRFMSFYLEPSADNTDIFFNRVVDPVWLEQSDDPNAAALRGARDDARKPASWRVLHRVTFVSRVLPRLAAGAQPSLERALQTLDIDSNFELIKQLDPFVSTHLDSFPAFADAVRATLRERLPELLPHADAIVQYMSQFYGIADGQDQTLDAERFGESTLAERSLDQPPIVSAGLPQTLDLDGAAVAADMDAAVIDDRLQQEAQIFTTWELLDGPADVRFDDPHVLDTSVSFSRGGRYLLRLTADDGRTTASDTVAVVVNERPRITAGPDQHLTGLTARMTGGITDTGLGDPASGKLEVRWSKVGRVGSVRFENDQALDTAVTFGERGTYLLKLTVRSGSFVVDDEVLVAVEARATGALEALYTFQEGAGAVVHDVSGREPPLDLAVADTATVAWETGTLRLLQPAALVAPGDARRLADAIQAAGELTVEAWVRPAKAFHDGLARIVTLTGGPASRGLLLGQVHGAYHGAVRTTATNPNASSRPLAAGSAVADRLTHLALTRDAAGATRLYLDGALAAERGDDGRVAGWDAALRLALGGEPGASDQGYAWSGALHLVAIYSRALSADEVRQNVSFGADADLPPFVAAGPDQALSWVAGDELAAPLAGRVVHDRLTNRGAVRWSQVGGPGSPDGVRFDDETDPRTTARFRAPGRYLLRLSADDGERMASDELALVVTQPPLVSVAPVAPVALPGRDAAVRLSAAVTPRGLGDPPGAISYRWRRTRGPASALLADEAALATDVTVSERGEYEFEITATLAAASGTLEARARVAFVVNQRPQVSAGQGRVVSLPAARIPAPQPTAVVAIASGEAAEVVAFAEPAAAGERQAAGVIVRLAGAVTDHGLGRPGDSFRTAWRGPAAATFDDPASPTTVVRLPAESGVYTLTLSGTNGTLEHEDSVQITVNRPPVVDAGEDRTVAVLADLALQATVYDDGLPLLPGALALSWSQRSGPGAALFAPPDGDFTTVRLTRSGTYELAFSADDGAARSTDSLTVTAVTPPRVVAGLAALYAFGEAQGAVRDTGGGGLDLAIEDAKAVQRRAGSLLVERQTIARSSRPAAELVRAIRASGALTLEAWLRPAQVDLPGQGPFRIVTISADDGRRNLTLAQEGRDYIVRVRTGAADANGTDQALRTFPVLALDRPAHLVFTLDMAPGGDRTPRLYIDGEPARLRREGRIEGGLTSWDEGFPLALANELTGGRGWRGELFLVALYARALSAAEVTQNYAAGEPIRG